MPPVSEKLQLQHLAWRAGFGEPLPVITKWMDKRRKEIVNKILIGKKDTLDAVAVISGSELPDYQKVKDMNEEQRKQMRQMNRQGVKDLNIAWTHAMINSEHPLREKMSLFWHGHFACRTQNVLYNQQLLQVIRENALGNFGELLSAVSKTPAILSFLNNQQNRKQHPNENFAREVMELFTMGRGNYTEKDIKEAARAFTGWGFDGSGQFVFRERIHDDGEKEVLGKRGNFNGDDMLKILLDNKQTAHYITAKVYRFFVNETTVDDAKVTMLADKFYHSGYDIKSLMREIFMADWFYNEQHIGNRIKSPVELLVGLRRSIPMQFEKEEVMLLFQGILGQQLFYPPNVAGWPGGRSWIDSSSLMFRLRMPQVILYSQELRTQPKDITPEMGEGQNYKMTLELNDSLRKLYARRVNATINWDAYVQEYKDIPRERLADEIAGALLVKNSGASKPLLDKYADSSTRENYIKTVTIDVMSTPEYQLC